MGSDLHRIELQLNHCVAVIHMTGLVPLVYAENAFTIIELACDQIRREREALDVLRAMTDGALPAIAAVPFLEGTAHMIARRLTDQELAKVRSAVDLAGDLWVASMMQMHERPPR